ncbi:MAG: hypothetical protein SNH13_04500 [Rikenellaceae bacterium]
MNILYKLLFTLMFVTTLCGCENSDDVNSEQQESIVSYLTSTHSPKLVTESEALSSLVPETPFYTKTGSTTYMYVEDYYSADRETMPEIANGSVVELTYTMYDFTDTTTPSVYTLLYTNDSDLKSTLISEGFNTLYWDFNPLEITIGQGSLFSTVERLMVGCHEGDILEFYLTTHDAYGDVMVGVAEEDSAVALFCEILKVVND